ncbi:MAG: dihydrodipicolinate synthase family protein [Eubacteriales bacterium]|nr:dihydrodipicolinate synthase family protein [Eubacteriales bacterium]
MREANFQGGVWPVMVTPFTKENKVDDKALKPLVEWYIEEGVNGLFAVCQSSEMFTLTLEERIGLAKKVVEYTHGRVPVIASGHISDRIEDQIFELQQMAATGIDALILITNRMAKEEESDDVWIRNTEQILEALPADMHLGLYECPYPYKRILSEKVTKWCADTGRFYFLKDTSCDMKSIRMKLAACQGSHLKLYNANTATLLESLRAGAYGYSGVMANMHPGLYRILCENYRSRDREVEKLEEFLTMCALIERQCYPVNAKYYLQLEQVGMDLFSRVKDYRELSETYKKEVIMLRDLSIEAEKTWERRRPHAAVAY